MFVDISAVQRAGLTSLTEDDIVEYETETNKRSGKPAVSTIKRA